jgi:hypothetical protein
MDGPLMMISPTRITRLSFVLLSTVSPTLAQGFDPSTPSKEYLRFDGQIVAIENAPAAAAPAAQLSPANFSFGNQNVQTTSAGQTATLTNTGNAALTISSVTISGTNVGDFGIAANTCGSSLNAGSACTVRVAFTPQAAGSRSASLTITDNAAGSPHTVALSGTGVSGPPPPTGFTTYVGPWGSANPSYSGTSVTLPLRAYNPAAGGAGDIGNLTTYLRNSSGTAEFSLILSKNSSGYQFYMYDSGTGYAPPSPLALTPNGQTTAASVSLSGLQVTATRLALVGNELQLDLTLTRSGIFSDQVTLGAISSNAYSNPWIWVSAAQWSSGTAGPVAQISPASLTFGSQIQGTTSAGQAVTVSNTGTASLTINSITMGGTNAGDFADTTTCGSTLAAGTSCTVTVTFTPLAAGSRSATLLMNDNAGGSPHTVALSGTGSAPPTAFVTYVGTWGSANPSYSGASATLPLRAYNPNAGGAGDIGNLTTYLRNSSGTAEFSLILAKNSGGYQFYMYDSGTGYAPPTPLTLTPNGQTTAASVSLSGLQVTATRLAVVGNELQLDLTLARSGVFSDQVTLGAISSNAYSNPWIWVSAAQWSN